MIRRRRLVRFVLRALALVVLGGPVLAQPAAPKVPRWEDTADFSLVMTSGNTEVSTFGLKNKLWRTGEKSLTTFLVGALRSKQVNKSFFAIGDPIDFSIVEVKSDELLAENYYVNGKYDRKINEFWYWLAGGGWLRNEFAGIRNRYDAFGGVGNIWFDKEKLKLRSDYSLSYVDQQDVVEAPGVDNSYPALRASSTYWQQVLDNTIYGNDTVLQANLEETSDFRIDMNNCVSVSMNSLLALKVGLLLQYVNEPAFEEIALFDLDPGSGGVMTGSVLRQLDKLDTVLTVALAVNFLGTGSDGSSPAC